MITTYCDGSIVGGHWGNKHTKSAVPRCYAAWYAIDESNKLIHHKTIDMGENPLYSATDAELFAIRSAMNWLSKNYEIDSLIVKSDSQVACRQLSGEYQVHSDRLRVYVNACKQLEEMFIAVWYEWIRREFNTIADAISKCQQDKYGGRELTHEEVESLLALHNQT